jgi:hypothetical protein
MAKKGFSGPAAEVEATDRFAVWRGTAFAVYDVA